jgi:hypothetical protein
MNTTGCPAFLATDEMFQANTEGACDTSLIGYGVYFGFICFLSFASAIRQTLTYLNLRKQGRKKRRRFPLAIINVFLLFLGIFLMALLGGLNVANFSNGGAAAIYSLAYLPFAWAYTYGLIKIVRLGEKMLPKAHRGAHGHLGRFDLLGKCLFAFQLLSIISGTVALGVLAPILTQYETTILRIGFGAKCLFIAFSLAGYVYQFERLIRTIRKARNDINQIVSLKSDRDELSEVIWKMRQTQLLHMTTTVSNIALFILAIGAAPASIWLVLLPAFMYTFGTFVYEFFVSNYGRPKPTSDHSPSKDHHQNHASAINVNLNPVEAEQLHQTNKIEDVDTPGNSSCGS